MLFVPSQNSTKLSSYTRIRTHICTHAHTHARSHKHTHTHTHTHYTSLTSYFFLSNFLLARQHGDDPETPGRWNHVWPRHHSCFCNVPIISLRVCGIKSKKYIKNIKNTLLGPSGCHFFQVESTGNDLFLTSIADKVTGLRGWT